MTMIDRAMEALNRWFTEALIAMLGVAVVGMFLRHIAWIVLPYDLHARRLTVYGLFGCSFLITWAAYRSLRQRT